MSVENSSAIIRREWEKLLATVERTPHADFYVDEHGYVAPHLSGFEYQYTTADGKAHYAPCLDMMDALRYAAFMLDINPIILEVSDAQSLREESAC